MSIIDQHYTIDWNQLSRIPEFAILKSTEQRAEFHAEGDVWTHTQMTIDALCALKEFQTLQEPDKRMVFLATLMHDIGKGVTTKRDNQGEWFSPKHGPVGARIARKILWQNTFGPVSFVERERIVSCIEFHGLPLWAHEKPRVDYTVRCLSQAIPLNLLALLSEADVRGRIATDQSALLERICFFRQLAEELQCYTKSFAFQNAFTRWSYAAHRHEHIEYTPYNDSWGEVIILCGVPGSGKDTWIQNHSQQLPVVSLDDIRIELNVDPSDKNQGAVVQLAMSRAKQLLSKHQSFIWNATNVRRQRRQELIDMCTQYNARVRLVYIETSYDELWRRNRERSKPVPDAVLHKMIDTLEVPKIYEASQVDYVIV